MTRTEHRRPTNGLAAAIAAIGRAIWQTYRLGGRTIRAAPLLLGIAIVPEFVQHVVEIHIGMFDGLGAFRAHAGDSLRWGFGYAKVAGFLIAILAVARFWAVRSVSRTLLVPPAALLRVVLACVAGFALAWPFAWLGKQGLPLVADLPLQMMSAVIQAGCTLYLVGALLADPAIGIRRAFVDLLPAAAVLLLLAALAFVPAQALHMANHKLALGQPAAVVWALMTFDALWIGLFAGLVGSALYVGYATGLSWRGWTIHPDDIDHATGYADALAGK